MKVANIQTQNCSSMVTGFGYPFRVLHTFGVNIKVIYWCIQISKPDNLNVKLLPDRGKCSWDTILRSKSKMVKLLELLILFWLHTTKNISPSPTLQIGSVCYIDVDHGSLINKKKKKNSLGLLIFCGECADLMPFSTNLCKKSIFIKN